MLRRHDGGGKPAADRLSVPARDAAANSSIAINGAQDDIVVWDNRCTMHCALGDFDETQMRHLERTTVLGTPSGYVAQAA